MTHTHIHGCLAAPLATRLEDRRTDIPTQTCYVKTPARRCGLGVGPLRVLRPCDVILSNETKRLKRRTGGNIKHGCKRFCLVYIYVAELDPIRLRRPTVWHTELNKVNLNLICFCCHNLWSVITARQINCSSMQEKAN